MAHSHCDKCVLISCTTIDEDCRVEACPNVCGASLHRCKIDEHVLHTCPESRVPCINSCFGCQAVLSRAELGRHLQHCPASVVQCRFSYERAPVDGSSDSTETLLEKKNGELSIDEKCLQADVALLAEQGNRLYTSNGPATGGESQPPDFSLDFHPGVDITDACSKSTARAHTLPPRTRVCITAATPYYSPYSNLSTRKYFCFPCNEIVRRDNYSGHWGTSHVDVHTNMCSIVERCPLRHYGCEYRALRMTPHPPGSSLEYLREADCIALRLPDHTTSESITTGTYAQHIQKQQELARYGYGDETESYDVLSQLPAEVLMKICCRLDSLGLWNLSLVNHYLRRVCFNLVKKRGIVYGAWQRNSETNKWEEGIKVCDPSLIIDLTPLYTLCVYMPLTKSVKTHYTTTGALYIVRSDNN